MNKTCPMCQNAIQGGEEVVKMEVREAKITGGKVRTRTNKKDYRLVHWDCFISGGQRTQTYPWTNSP